MIKKRDFSIGLRSSLLAPKERENVSVPKNFEQSSTASIWQRVTTVFSRQRRESFESDVSTSSSNSDSNISTDIDSSPEKNDHQKVLLRIFDSIRRILNDLPITTETTKERLENILKKLATNSNAGYSNEALAEYLIFLKKYLAKQFKGKNKTVENLIEEIPATEQGDINLFEINQALSRIAGVLSKRTANLFPEKVIQRREIDLPQQRIKN